jgi:hypothetical protein
MEVTKEVLLKYGKKDMDQTEEEDQEFTMMGGGFVDPNATSNKQSDFEDSQILD